MKVQKIIIWVVVMLATNVQAGKIISGYLQDSTNGEKLIGAYIRVDETDLVTTSNNFGFFSIELNSDFESVRLLISHTGFEGKELKVRAADPMPLVIQLDPIKVFRAAVVKDRKQEKVVNTSQMSAHNLSMADVKMMPKFFGETDIIKAIQLYPGIKGGPEGSSGLYVRGGGADQNLILLDGVPVYNASHLFGFFSVFNTDAISNVQVLKGGFPARYGGRLSSVLDIALKDGNMRKYNVEGSIGALASKLAIEGPIKKDKASFIICGRRTYVDFLTKPLMRLVTGDQSLNQGYYFSDLNAKVNWKINKTNRVYLSYYGGNDKFYNKMKPYSYLYDGSTITESSENNTQWGNRILALRWNKSFSNSLFLNTQINYTQYKFQINNIYSTNSVTDTGDYEQYNKSGFQSSVRDITIKSEAEQQIGKHFYRAGITSVLHRFEPGKSVIEYRETGQRSVDTSFGSATVNSLETALYAEDDMNVSKKFKLNYGLHLNLYNYNKYFKASVQPRVAARYLIRKDLSVKASYSRMNQNIHLLTNNSLGLPNDLWVPATDKVKPMISNQVAMGIAKSFRRDVEFTFETYYKDMRNVIEYKEGASYLGYNSSWEEKVLAGKGTAYGFEFLLQKKAGNLTGWIGYTLSWSQRQINGINNDQKFFYKYDSRHDISFVLNYKENEKWDYGLVWVFRTGNAITMPVGNYPGQSMANYNGGFNPSASNVYVYNGRNNFRFADYHRLDLSVTRHYKKSWGMIDLNFSIYNAYSRINPFYYKIGYDGRGNKQIKRVGLFPFLPSMNIAFKF